MQRWIKGCQIVPSLWLYIFLSSDYVFFDGENDRFENTLWKASTDQAPLGFLIQEHKTVRSKAIPVCDLNLTND